MAVDKPLTVRDYLEPRFAAAAGARVAGTARKGMASFQQLLKSETPKQAEGALAGMNVSDYLKNPVLRTQVARLPRMRALASSAAAGPRSTDTKEEAKTAAAAAQPAKADRAVKSGPAGAQAVCRAAPCRASAPKTPPDIPWRRRFKRPPRSTTCRRS